ncbi:MAG: hypothetical protein E7368_03050, partial [Clostridiales bacterium]|nr:hypothetical protein [Clostridiales bacterium]
MKKYIANITAGLMAFTLLAGCNKGDGTSNAIPPAKEHTCSFTQEVVAPEYLKKGPTCTTPAMYYYSCTCGEKDKDFFTIGEARGHRGGTATATQKATCTVCGQEYGDYAGGTHTHAYTERVTTSKYLKSEATCGDPAVYYYACACGEVGTDTFEYGEPTGKHTGGTATATQKATCTVCGQEYGDYLEETHTHAYTEMVTTSKYLVSEATCGDPAVYHYSCACGEVGTNTFEYGEPTGEHTGGTATETQRATCTVCGQEYGDFAKPEEPEEHVCVFEMVVDAQYLRKKATCEYPASYYLSCTCGETSLEYFYNGAKEDHVELVPATELSRAICAVCEEEYGDFLPHDHVYTKRIVSAEYLKKAATCGTPAEYWLVCACGEKSTSLSYQAGDPTGKHEVGTPATTTSQAVCKNCLQPYGETLLSAVTNISISSGYTRYDLGTALSRKTEGFGTQFDTCIVEQQNGMSEADWQVQVKALKEMNLQNVRVRFYPEMYERGNDNNDPYSFDYQSASVDFNSLEMQHLYKLLDAFEENGVKVDLSWYGCRTTFASEDGLIKGSWLGGKLSESYNGLTPNWIVAPWKTSNPNEEFAESVAECLGYLFNEKGYTCINEYSIFPEPDGMFNPGTGKAMT